MHAWMKRLIVSIIASIGISGVGVPCGKKWASDALVLYRPRSLMEKIRPVLSLHYL